MKQKVITTEEALEADRRTCEAEGCTALDLIRKAGKALEEVFTAHFQPKPGQRIGIFSGCGHNGADALVVGQLLQRQGKDVVFVILGRPESLKPENREILSEIQAAGGKTVFFHEEKDLPEVGKIIRECSFLVDGIFGTGLNKEVSGFLRSVIELLGNAKNIFSIDIPSGLSGDNGLVQGAAVKADLTAVIEHFKAGNLLNQASDHHGVKTLVRIGLKVGDCKRSLLTKEEIAPVPRRRNFSHKYDYGNVLIVGGSPEMTGAPVLSGQAALRSGAGLVTLALPKEARSYIKHLPPEIIARYYSDFSEFHQLLERKDAFAFGPGLGKKNSFSEAILGALLDSNLPVVVDADGIYYLKKFLKEGSRFPNVIITPHLGELAQFVGMIPEKLTERSLEVVSELAKEHELTIVLKGPCTIIANKEEIWFQDAPNPGLATAGAGDVLTGVIASLLGQGMPLLEAAKTGVFLHSLAGELARAEYGEAGMIAGDVIGKLPEAIKRTS